MRLENVRLHQQEGLFDILFDQGMIQSITAAGTQRQPDIETCDAGGKLALPPFIDPHVHLDTCLTAGEPVWNRTGTLFEGIQNWSERKKTLSHDDVKQRASKALSWYIGQGVQHVRSHVDTTDPSLTAVHALLELKEEVKDLIDIQLVAFPQEGVPSFPKGAELLEEAMKLGCDAVGGIPHFEYTREYALDSLNTIFDLAEKYDSLIDIHCDEIDDEQSRFVETVACLALERNMGQRVTASHTTAMHSYNNAYVVKLMRLLKRSGIHFIANPVTNLNLQGRMDTYPKRRGITRIPELLEAGVNACFGQDDIVDQWFPMQGCNMLQVLFTGLVGCQMTGLNQINQGIDLITTNSATCLNIQDQYGIEAGKPANLILLDAESVFDAIRRQSVVTHSYRNGQLIAETKPAETNIKGNHALSGDIDYSFSPN
ncbi:cytosine deaminase [Endozoicomonas numazuensis]|uniref:Cytosine deaminase n=1 Tax=Endozoicomonas numazuensis TaxID=1137799 RepID=A0A081N3W5_9GAMM|nr:cytosine deaminase [Endozoicomonas numazuensis]KEQ13138.1 cytosine deaminase [Endozoicomonas numazuensis]